MALHAPKTHPRDYGFKKGDYHLIVNAATDTVKAYTFEGKLLWEKPCLPEGLSANWRSRGGDTPPSVYKLGTLYNDIQNGTMERPFGWMFWDLVDCDESFREDGENSNYRSGIGLHGGGSALDDPFAPYQPLVYTQGCVRMHNKDMADYVYPLYKEATTVYLSVYQDDN